MPSKEVVDAVNTVLAGWTAATIIGPNASDNEPPQDGSPYVQVDYPLSESRQLTIGSPGANVFREEGVFRLVIHAVRGAGVDAGLVWAAELAALFRNYDDGDGFRTFAPSPPTTDDDSESGNYYRLSIAVPYFYDIIG